MVLNTIYSLDIIDVCPTFGTNGCTNGCTIFYNVSCKIRHHTTYKLNVDELEKYLSRAEIAYKSGQVLSAIKNAQQAIKICKDENKKTALNIFTARAYSKIGDYKTSNAIYRKLLNENTYMPPIIMGLLYNSVKQNNNMEKTSRNLGLIKLYVR